MRRQKFVFGSGVAYVEAGALCNLAGESGGCCS